MTLDTNILIAYLAGDAATVQAINGWQQEGRALFISSVSAAELFSLSTLDESEMRRIRSFLGNFIAIPLDNTLAEPCAFFRRMYRLPLPDSAIAATAFMRGVPLITRDQQFRKIKEIAVVAL